ncbi:MAG: hypothetical protein H0U86_13910 [Chloroflexi bacterium]|nr:hypothetical protein [Chloroflexota bacterium]
MDMPLLEGIDDSFLAELIAEGRNDPETVGLLLHGSRALATHRDDSDYDLIRIVTEDAYAARRDRNALVEKSAAVGLPKLDVLYQSQARVERYVADPGWYTATYLSAKVLFDRSGEIAALLGQMATEAGRIAREQTPAAYDDYLNSFVRSIKAARRGDDLGRRMHAAASASALVRTLFGLQSTWPPYHDNLAAHLPRLEEVQGWPAGYLSAALLRLIGEGDPTFQQELEARVEDLMSERGVPHEWGDDLEPMKVDASLRRTS